MRWTAVKNIALVVVILMMVASCQGPPRVNPLGKAFLTVQGQQISLANFSFPFVKDGQANVEIIIPDNPSARDVENGNAIKALLPGASDPITPNQATGVKHVILIGTPCTNSVMLDVWGIPQSQCQSGLEQNAALLRLDQEENQVGLSIASPSNDEIAKAISVLGDKQRFPLRGLQARILGPPSNISIEQECVGEVKPNTCVSPNTAQAKYCLLGNLVGACQFCGCPSGLVCPGPFQDCVAENQTQVKDVKNESEDLSQFSELAQASSESVQVRSGLNAFSLKHKQAVDLTRATLGPVAIFSFDAQLSPPWRVFRQGAPSDLSRLVPGKGYYLESSSASTIIFPLAETVDPAPFSSSSPAGRYLIGVTGNQSRPLSAFIPQGLRVTELFQAKDEQSPSLPTGLATLLEPGFAYWVTVERSST